MPPEVMVVDVAPRDGLQNEQAQLTIAQKVELIDRLAEAGVPRIEAGAFVNPKVVPQMADSDDVLNKINRRDGVEYAGLVANLKGLDRALDLKIDVVNVVVVATETFNMRNARMTCDESLAQVHQIADRARERGVKPTAVLGASFFCPFEGVVALERVFEMTEAFVACGITELTLADTVGAATPNQVAEACAGIRGRWPEVALGLHLHDTRGLALVNALAGLGEGVVRLESSLGGIGGCPFAPDATGNACTEDLVFLLESAGVRTGIDLFRLLGAASFAQDAIGRTLPGRLLAAGLPAVTVS